MQRSIETLRVLLKDDPRLVDLADSAWGWRSEAVAPTPAFKVAKPVVLSRDAAKVVGENIGSPTPGDAATTVPWSGVTDKPLTFLPSEHTHTWGSIADKPLTFPPSAHTHLWVDITDKPPTFPPSAHTHVWADITDEALVLDGYLPLTAGASKAVTGNLHLNAWLYSRAPRASGFSHAEFGGGGAGNAGTIRFARGSDGSQGAAIGYEASANEASEFRFSAFGTTTSYMAWHLRDASSTREVMRLNTSGGLAIGGGSDPGSGGLWLFGRLQLTASTATRPLMNIGAGGVTLTAPANGDMWRVSDDILFRDSTATRTLWHTGNLTGLQSAHWHNWASIPDKPSTFPPSAHTHVWGDITTGLNAGRVMLVGTGGVPTDSADFRYANRILTIDGSEPRYYLHGPATAGRFFSTRTNNLNVWEWGTPGTGWDATQPWVLIAYNDAEAEIDRPIIVGRAANTNITFSRKLALPTGTTTRAGLNLGGTGVAPTTPVDGDVWRVADQAFIRMGSNTREVLLSGPNQTIGGIKTFQGHIICATPSGGIASLVLPAGTTTLTAEGTTWNDSGRRALMSRINGLNQEVTTCMWQGVNHTAVTTTTETSLLAGGSSTGTLTIPANTLVLGRMLRVTVAILLTPGASMNYRLKLGGTTVCSFATDTATYYGTSEFVTVSFLVSASAAPGASVTVYTHCDHNISAGQINGMFGITSSGTVATNAALAVDVTVQCGIAGTIKANISSVELL